MAFAAGFAPLSPLPWAKWMGQDGDEVRQASKAANDDNGAGLCADFPLQ